MDQIITGISTGTFDSLWFMRAGSLQEMNNVLDALSIGGGGGGIIQSATYPLTISGGVLSINLSNYLTQAQINTLLQQYVTQTLLNTTLSSYSNTTAMNSAISSASGSSLHSQPSPE